MRDTLHFAVERLDPRDIVAVAQTAVLDADSFPYPSTGLRGPGQCIWIARADVTAKVVGFLTAQLGAGKMYIVGLAVDRAEQRRGIGHHLLTKCITVARRTRAPYIELHVGVSNAAAVALYESAGFRVMRRVHEFYSPGVYSERDAFRMVLRLTTLQAR